MILKQETVTMFFNLYVRLSKCLVGQDVSSPHLASLGLTVKAAVLPVSKDSPSVLYLCNFTLSE